MSSDLEERVSELLSTVRETFESGSVSESADADSLEAIGEDHELADRAAEAREIVDTADPDALLEAVGLAELPDGSEPSSIPEAIARGPEDRVRELHALVTLASLDEWGEGEGADELEAALSDLRETLVTEEAGGDEPEDDTETGSETDEDGAEGDAEAEASADEGADGEETNEDESGNASESAEATGADEASEEDEDDSDSAIGETLRAAAGTTAEQFSDDVESLRAQLQSLSGDGEDEGDTAEASDGEDEEEVGREDEGEASEEGERADEEADEGHLDFGGGLGGDDESRRSRMHSTMPPSPSRRADMRAVRRHSTMPDRR